MLHKMIKLTSTSKVVKRISWFRFQKYLYFHILYRFSIARPNSHGHSDGHQERERTAARPLCT
jgi:hypothetical protein